jgi:4-diphosphocytidyl-2-C-methyl-D-erythritol kinase
MSPTQTKILTIFAPAKINLYLHITGKLDNGYHTLDSLVCFADIGDRVEIEPATDFEFRIKGPFAGAFSSKETDASPHSSNLIVQAVWALSRAAQKVPNVRVTLTKNLPLASGMGGGSSDAAAVIWGLLEWWGLSNQALYLPGLMAQLGAGVPVCLPCKPARVRGIGDVLDSVPHLPEVPIVLVHPSRPCPTAHVFSGFNGAYQEPRSLPPQIESFDGLIGFLKSQDNMLEAAAYQQVPEILNATNALKAQKDCALARMTGSGATCFGLFAHEAAAQKAARVIAIENPDWWVKSGWINRPERY